MNAPIHPNWIYTVDTGSGTLAVLTSKDKPELPSGKALEAQPIYHGIAGFMLGAGESVDGNAYRARISFAGGNHFRNLGSWKGRLVYGNGLWTIREGMEIALDHYVAGRSFLAGTVGVDCTEIRDGKAEVVLTGGGKEIRLLEVAKVGVTRRKLADDLMPMACPSIVIRGLDGCDLDLRGYLFDGTLDGRPVPAEAGATTYFND